MKLIRKMKQINGQLALLLRHVASATGGRSRPLVFVLTHQNEGNSRDWRLRFVAALWIMTFDFFSRFVGFRSSFASSTY